MFGRKFATKLTVFFFSVAVSSLLSVSRAQEPATRVPGHIRTTAAPEVRVVGKIDETKRTTLLGHVPSAIHHASDLGRLDPSTPAEHMVLVLKSSDSQKAELRRVLDEQQDKKTENYHQWITPEDFGSHFGVHDDDIAQVSSWLQSHGFKVEDVSKSKRVLHFTGTTGQLEDAFKTEIHSYQVGAEKHVSNNSEISVPTALSPVIAGLTMNDFSRKSQMSSVRRLKDVQASQQNPLYTVSSTVHYVGPWDFAKIYNTLPLLNSGITGAGSSIAIVGRSDILMSDVQTYRQMFGLPVNDPIFIHAGQDNGIEPGDDGESDLDVEISGGIAPNAQVYFVIGTPTFLVDGITNSIEYIVENNVADIVSISYGSCESVEGVGGNEFNSQAFEQAAAQGMSVFVAAGDNGPAECDDQNDSYENLGYSTGAESSTWYNVSVGGSGLAESLTPSDPASILTTSTTGPEYWSSTGSALTGSTPGATALSYIPETPWNISKDADYSADPSADLSGLWSGSGGISSYYTQPPWQRGTGVYSADPALTNGGDWVTSYTITNGGSGYTTAPTVTIGSGCLTKPALTAVITSGAVTGLTINYGTQGGTLAGGQGFGCTSTPSITFSAPSSGTTAMATLTIGPMWNTPPLITGVPHRYTPDLVLNADNGNDATIFCSEGVCEYNPATGALTDAGLVGGTSVAAPSMAGIQALINQANGGRQGAPNYIYYALSAAQTESGCNSSLGTGVGSACAFHDITAGDNLICGESSCTKGTYPTPSATKMGWYAGTGYDLATGLGSVNAAVLSSQWKNVVFNSSSTTLNLSKTTGIAQGSSVTISGTVSPGSGSGTPTGDVAFILSQGEFGQTVNVNTGAFNGPGAFATLSGGSYSASIDNLPAGTYTVTARYGGDENFASSMSAPVTVTVGGGAATVTITPEWFNDTVTCTLSVVNSYTYGQFAWIPAAVTAVSGQGLPTGTVTFTVDGQPYATETLDPQGNGYLAAGTLATSSCLYDYMFAQSPTLTGGMHTIGASYSGDSTFSPATAAPVTVTVNKLTSTPVLTVGATTLTSGATVPLNATFTVAALTGSQNVGSGPTGTVTFMEGTTVLATAPAVPTVVYNVTPTSESALPTYTFGAVANASTTLITSSGTVTAVYSGDSNYLAATSTGTTVTVSSAGTATSVVVTSSANPTTIGGRPTFTATMTPTTVTSGTVSFFDGATFLGTGAVGSTHTATFRPATTYEFTGGTHNITAVFGGTSTFAPSTSPILVETVTKGTGSINLNGKLAGTYGQAFTFAAVLTPSPTGAAYPLVGTVQFLDGSTPIGTGIPATINEAQGGYGLWTAPVSLNLSAGTHTITATYSDSNYTFSTSNALTVVVNPASLTVTANNATMTAGSALPAFTATITGFVNGDSSSVVSGAPSLTTTATSSSPAGTYPITASLGTLSAANYTFAFVNGTLSITTAAPTVILTTTATLSGSAASGYTATVTVTNSGTGPASAVTLTTATLGGVSATSGVPQSLGAIPAGGSVMTTVGFSGAGTTDGARSSASFAGTYAGGGTFSGSMRVVLP